MSLELSPGFFDPKLAMSDDDDEQLVPQNVNVEEMNDDNKENVVISFLKFMIVNVRPGAECACKSGWSRISSY
jgi:hypothetical protein